MIFYDFYDFLWFFMIFMIFYEFLYDRSEWMNDGMNESSVWRSVWIGVHIDEDANLWNCVNCCEIGEIGSERRFRGFGENTVFWWFLGRIDFEGFYEFLWIRWNERCIDDDDEDDWSWRFMNFY